MGRAYIVPRRKFESLADTSWSNKMLTLLHSERPKLYGVLAFLSAKGLMHEK